MDDRTLMISLRLLHVLAGVFWVGAALLLNLFLAPVLRDMGPQAGRFMQQLMVVRRLATWLGVAAALAVLSGFAMYARISVLTDGAFASTSQGTTLGIGALAAIVGGLVGAVMGGASARRMTVIGARLEGASGPPEPAVAAEMQRLQRRATMGGAISVALLVLATAAMATARYL